MDVDRPLVLNHTPTLDEIHYEKFNLNCFRKCSQDISGLVKVVIPQDRLPLQ
jgi:hypothetical protein